eukprot:56908-Eustigmatos_ZCMA.PRE.1
MSAMGRVAYLLLQLVPHTSPAYIPFAYEPPAYEPHTDARHHHHTQVTSDPNKNAHAKAIREDSHYRTWLLPRVKAYVREKGWAMPRLAALD